jgi:hypothetical protein
MSSKYPPQLSEIDLPGNLFSYLGHFRESWIGALCSRDFCRIEVLNGTEYLNEKLKMINSTICFEFPLFWLPDYSRFEENHFFTSFRRTETSITFRSDIELYTVERGAKQQKIQD